MGLGTTFHLQIIGMDHTVADLNQREKCAFSKEEIPNGIKKCLKLTGVREVAILSTCNRVEIVAVIEQEYSAESKKILTNFLQDFKGYEAVTHLFDYSNLKAVEHLYRVASGMESMILGEYQILSQVKESLDLSNTAGGIDTILHGLFAKVITASKRVRTETQLGVGAVSVAGSAVDLIKKIFNDLSKHKALIIGAGDTGQLVAKHLVDSGIGDILVTNRTLAKAETLAKEINANVVEFDKFCDVLKDVDIVFGTTASNTPVLNMVQLKKALVKRTMRPLALIDIAVPRDFEVGIDKLEFVFLHCLDDLQKLIAHTIDVRRQELGLAESIVLDEAKKFVAWCNSLDVAPTIVALRSKVMQIQDVEINRQKNKLSPAEIENCLNFSTAVLNKLLHLPISQLKQCDINNNSDLRRIKYIRESFGLDNSG